MTYNTIPHMEGIEKTAEIFGISAYQVRKLARSPRGKAFTVKLGSKYLINQEKFTAFLNCELPEQEEKSQGTLPIVSGIQPVPVKL